MLPRLTLRRKEPAPREKEGRVLIVRGPLDALAEFDRLPEKICRWGPHAGRLTRDGGAAGCAAYRFAGPAKTWRWLVATARFQGLEVDL
jgi:hypothetical protein